MSQMTLSQMSITETTASPQHKLQWLAEQALNWSGLPVVHVRPTVFLEGFLLIVTADSVRESNQIRLPFGEGKTSPVAVDDVARVVATLLENPQPHIGKISPNRSAVREHAFLGTGVFEGAWPHDHLSGHSGRAVAGRAAPSRLAGSPGEPPRDDGRSAPRGTVRPNVGRRAHAHRTTAVERAGGGQEECRDIHRVGKSGLSVCGCSHSTNEVGGLHILGRSRPSHPRSWMSLRTTFT